MPTQQPQTPSRPIPSVDDELKMSVKLAVAIARVKDGAIEALDLLEPYTDGWTDKAPVSQVMSLVAIMSLIGACGFQIREAANTAKQFRREALAKSGKLLQ